MKTKPLCISVSPLCNFVVLFFAITQSFTAPTLSSFRRRPKPLAEDLALAERMHKVSQRGSLNLIIK
jgi:hypothetical protein